MLLIHNLRCKINSIAISLQLNVCACIRIHQVEKAEAAEAQAQKAARARIPPQDIFKDKKNLDGMPMYRDFDADGIPTSNSSGEPVSIINACCSQSIIVLCGLWAAHAFFLLSFKPLKLSKNALKSLRKEYERQKKVYEKAMNSTT